MASIKSLPVGYRRALQLDLQTDKKLRFNIALAASLICLFMGLYGNSISPIVRYFRGSFNQIAYAFLGIILYMILHELIHGFFMWVFGGEPARFGLSMPFTFARSQIYFNKFQYSIIALAPVLIWGLVLLGLCSHYLKTDWFWTFYFVQIVNLSGAASDIYVVFKFWNLPSKALIQDTGTAIAVYITG